MNIVLEQKTFCLQNNNHEEYQYANDEEVMKISRRILEKHREAYIALANA